MFNLKSDEYKKYYFDLETHYMFFPPVSSFVNDDQGYYLNLIRHFDKLQSSFDYTVLHVV